MFVEYASDVDSAVEVLCRGTDFAEAYRLVSRVLSPLTFWTRLTE